jgi:histidinol phosphatase-like PHP family hydrolase
MKFDSHIFEGRYLFHLHTTLTDSKVSIVEYFESALRHGFTRLIFLEHVRREASYDTTKFFERIRECESQFSVPTSIGFETKLLPSGALDIDNRDLNRADVIGIAEHGFPNDFELYESAIKKAFSTYTPHTLNKPVVWVHPGLWFKKNRVMHERKNEYASLLGLAQSNGLRIERNLRYLLLPDEFVCLCSPTALVIGADSHKLEDIERCARLLTESQQVQESAFGEDSNYSSRR